MSAGYPVVQSQPHSQHVHTFSKPTAMVPTGLECLLEVEDVILKDKVFQTKNRQNLFSVRRKFECCGPAFSLRLRNPYKRDVLSLHLISEGCCGEETYVRISSQDGQCIGIVSIDKIPSKLKVSIQRSNREPVFTAKMPIYMDDKKDNTIEILGMDGSQPVAYIIKEKKGKSSRVTFHFPLNMEAASKAAILGAFLYMSFRVQEISHSHRSSNNHDGWANAGGIDFTYMFDHHGDYGGGGGGGDFGGGGGGDFGGGGGDCGGGGDFGGGGGGDFGGGGGDCGGGGCGGGM